MCCLLLAMILVAPSLSSGGPAGEGQASKSQREERALCGKTIRRIEPSPYGGISIKVMLRLDGGSLAVYKPEQTHWAARYEAEIVAYRLAMHLGVDRVPPACERRLRLSSLLEIAARPEQVALRARLEKELRPDPGGWVRGAVIAWVPRVTELPASRMATLATWLAPGALVPVSDRARVADLADVLLLDLLFANPDRFTGGNLLEDRSTGRLLMIDNGADFRPVGSLTRPHNLVQLGLLRRVRAPTYQRMKRLDRKTVIALARRPAGQGIYLTWPEVRALLGRRDALVRHVEGLRQTHGDAAVFLP